VFFFIFHLHLMNLLGSPHLIIIITFGMEKLECWVYQMAQKVYNRPMFKHNTQTRHTERWVDRHRTTKLAKLSTASCSKHSRKLISTS